MSQPRAPRYPDMFRNALMHSHQSTCRGELFFGGVKVDDLDFVSGTISADRGSSVRRTFAGDIDPSRVPTRTTDFLTPYGGQLSVYRGIRYPNGSVQEYPVFFGRIESVEFGRFQVSVRAQDRAADLVDARFESPVTAVRGAYIYDQIKNLILDVDASAVVNVLTTNTATISTPATWDRERTEALDNLAQTIGAEWFAGPDGQYYIKALPALNASAAVWIVDSGDTGVAIARDSILDRARVYNAVVVNGEAPDGSAAPAYGVARDNDASSPTLWGGPFGKVPRFFSSQFITTDAQAQATAVSMLADAISGTRGVSVSCVANPKLNTGDVVVVSTGAGQFDGSYYVNTFSLPLEPETPMTLGLNVALEADPGFTVLRPASVRVEEGILWG